MLSATIVPKSTPHLSPPEPGRPGRHNRFLVVLVLAGIHYRGGGGLLIEVPIPAKELYRLVEPPETQRWMLSATLLSFLGLLDDPGIPDLDFAAWREALERAFREEEFS